ncbi:DUF1990 family protein [Leucobacter sp. W1153]|uniref:DUF1990 family protein n=1 Tax=unclassified Leucobacter TaxID=2621730 RepID=UPI003F3F4CAD
MIRRSTHVDQEVVYAAVGASADPDLLRFPPEGSTAYAEELRLGSGADRFLAASSRLMTWAAPRGVGLAVTEIDLGDGGQYSGVVFTEEGVPEVPAPAEVQFGPEGEPYLTAGTTARLVWPDQKTSRLIRVVYTVDEPRRVGYAWGSADSEGVVGEEAFLVEHRDDDSVWATVRGFVWPPATGLLGLKGRAAVRYVLKQSKEQLAALAPGAAPTLQEGQVAPSEESLAEETEESSEASGAADSGRI